MGLFFSGLTERTTRLLNTSVRTVVTMQILVRGSETYFVEAEDVAAVLEAVRAREGAEEVLLYDAGRPLEAEDSLEGVETIDVNVPLKGGKVHGSLARAGKVRGQTPKVDPQEKKKKKTGRAKRRIQYNRRFVNVVQTFGRRRGPNANS